MMKQKTINAEPFHTEVEMRSVNGGFVLVIYTDRYKLRLHFKSWWVKYLARHLWEIYRTERARLEAQLEAMVVALKGEER